MSPGYQDRVKTEALELGVKIERLAVCLSSTFAESLELRDYLLLAAQLDVMQQYHDVLSKRIQRFDL